MTVDMLREYGANVDEGLARCFGNEGFYLKLVRMIPNEAGFEKLETFLAQGEIPAAFEAAHALKGVIGNLSLTPLYEPVSEITELLRAGDQTGCTELLEKIKEEKEKLVKICES